MKNDGKKIMGFIRTTLILVLYMALVSSAYGAPVISSIAANPEAFNSNTGSTNINYILNDIASGNVLLEIFNPANNLVRTINGGIQSSGTQSIMWNGKDNSGIAVPEGSYTARLDVSIGDGDNYDFLLELPAHQWYFNSPQGVAVDSGGNVYVAERGTTRIQKFSSTGAFITKWGSFGFGDGEFLGPYGIAVDSGGNVYVVEGASKHGIQKFSSTGAFIAKWGSYGSGDGQFNLPLGVAVDSGGNVYVADTFNNRIQKFSSDGAFIASWGSSGSGDGEFNYPFGVAVDSGGNVYVADASNNRIQKFSSDGAFIAKWGSYGSGEGQFNSPQGVAVDSDGNVYVADIGNNRIQKFAPTGAAISAQTSVFVDNIPPSIAIFSPEAKDYLHSESITTSFDATDALSGIAAITAALDGGAVVSGQVIDLKTLALGQHTLTVNAADKAGNSASNAVTFNIKPVQATIEVKPDTLNKASQSDKNAITAYIEIPGYDVNAIDVSTVNLNTGKGSVSAQLLPTEVGDYDSDGVPDRMVKFDRQAVIQIVDIGEKVNIVVRGKVAGAIFEGSDEIRVIEQGKK